jgi:preprotein translocase subunit SecY
MDDDDPPVIVEGHAVPQENKTAIAVLQAQVRMIVYELRHSYVRRDEFAPIRLIVYGIVAVIMSSVLVAIVSFVIKANNSH